jgi:hypothetical protein
MARSARNPHPNALPKGEERKRRLTFRHSVKVAVETPEFELLDAVSHLDVAALERAARAEIEVGYVASACCRQLVRAVIRKGMVVEMKVEPCAGEALKASPELVRLLEAARRTVGRGGRPGRLPMPIAAFLASAARISVQVLVCVRICFFGVCVNCCHLEGSDDWICGRVTIDTTKPG